MNGLDRGRKKAGNAWGDSGSRDRTLPYLDAVVASASSQPPNLSKIPSATATAKGGVKAKGAAARPGTVPAAKAATPGNRKRKAVAPAAPAPAKKGPSANKKREAKPKAAAGVQAETEELQGAEVSAEGEEMVATKLEEDEEPDEAHIKEVEVRIPRPSIPPLPLSRSVRANATITTGAAESQARAAESRVGRPSSGDGG